MELALSTSLSLKATKKPSAFVRQYAEPDAPPTTRRLLPQRGRKISGSLGLFACGISLFPIGQAADEWDLRISL